MLIFHEFIITVDLFVLFLTKVAIYKSDWLNSGTQTSSDRINVYIYIIFLRHGVLGHRIALKMSKCTLTQKYIFFNCNSRGT